MLVILLKDERDQKTARDVRGREDRSMNTSVEKQSSEQLERDPVCIEYATKVYCYD